MCVYLIELLNPRLLLALVPCLLHLLHVYYIINAEVKHSLSRKMPSLVQVPALYWGMVNTHLKYSKSNVISAVNNQCNG